MALLPTSVLLLLSIAHASTWEWGEDREAPTEEECYDLWGGSTGKEPPPGCESTSEVETGLDACGCYRVVTTETICETGSTSSTEGATCSARGGYLITTSDDASSAWSASVSIPGTGNDSFEISEVLVGLDEIAHAAGWELTPLQWNEGDGSGDVGLLDADVDAGDQSFPSLQVDGVYVVLGDLEVSGSLGVTGYLLVVGDVTAGDVELSGHGVDSGALDGGVLASLSLVAESLVGEDCLLFTRDLFTNELGSVVVSGDARFDACLVEAGEGVVAGGDLTFAGSTVAASALDAAALSLTNTTVARLGTLVADRLAATTSVLENGSRLDADVAGEATFEQTRVQAQGLAMRLGGLQMDGASSFESLHRDASGIVLPLDPEEPGATGLFYEQAWGASFGGYGGLETFLGVALRPADPPTGDPREVTGHGVDGWAIGTATSTEGGGGGNELSIVVSGSAVLHGALDANGGSAPVGPTGGGGSGGSGGAIRVEAATVAGNAVLRANGGDGSMQADGDAIGLTGGGGSGGRIAVIAGDLSGMVFQFESVGGLGGTFDGVLPQREVPPSWSSPLMHGGPGTVYLSADDFQTLLIDGDGLDPAGFGCAGGPVCRGVGVIPEDLDGVDVHVQDATVAIGSLRAASLTLSGARLVVDDPRARLPWPEPGVSAVAEGLSTGRALPVAVYQDPLDERLVWTLTDSLWVGADSEIDVSGFGGYSRRTPDGIEDQHCWNGGSHGGVGGHGISYLFEDMEPEGAFDDPTAPVEPGHGGCSDLSWTGEIQEWCGLGGIGGAALRVDAGGELVLQGRVAADGFDGQSQADQPGCLAETGTAGGAGGALWLTGASVSGSGTLSAAGGDGKANDEANECGGGGGGGRIALVAAAGSFEGTYGVAGGTPGCAPPPVPEAGTEGSVYVAIGAPDTGDTGDTADTAAGDPDERDDPATCGCAAEPRSAPVAALAAVATALFSRRRRRG